ncbi:hypothetical protein T265_09243 [Opisthorchis viverrini]|uniref:Lactate/malate dehydrogenase N-terminal domain-containing protein n=1 Tax=Opisthorchis viverrini TaxID=6198 RepID=A0A075A5P5_OPIVI|nr:hypothetical protein T265_09243 [Opisthorchis viverrini]KER22724.1 hypothetical protein T265_09243 [Opisthorchis viverrini]
MISGAGVSNTTKTAGWLQDGVYCENVPHGSGTKRITSWCRHQALRTPQRHLSGQPSQNAQETTRTKSRLKSLINSKSGRPKGGGETATTLNSSNSKAAEAVLKCLFTNCLSFFNKLDYVKQSACLEQPSRIALTETRFAPDGIPTELVIVDLNVEKVEAEISDLQNARQYLPKVSIYGGSNYKLSANSNIAILCAGVDKRDNENQLSHVQRNVDALKSNLLTTSLIATAVIPHLVENSPKCTIIVLIKPGTSQACMLIRPQLMFWPMWLGESVDFQKTAFLDLGQWLILPDSVMQ